MLKAFAAFFAFGTCACALTIALLLFPGTQLDRLWALNPEAQIAFQSIGRISVLLMFAVGSACALSAVGLWRNTRWGIPLAILVLAINIVGDLFNALVRHDYRALIGLPIGGAMIFLLARRRRARGR